MSAAETAGFGTDWQRLRALTAFCDRRQRERLGARLSLLYGWGLALTYSAFVLLSAGDAFPARALVLTELRLASWVVVGLCALTLAADWDALDRSDGVSALLRQRGLPSGALSLARFLAGTTRLTLLVAAPAWLLCALAAARVHSLGAGLSFASLATAATVYAFLLGATVSGLVRVARLLLPERGRLMLLLLVLLPHAARELWPQLPSVPAAFAGLLSLVEGLGSAIS